MNHFNQICHIKIEWLRFIRTFRFDLKVFSELNWFRFNSKYQNEFLFFYIVYIVTAGRGYTTSFRYQDSLTAQKLKFSIKDFFSKCDQIRRKLRISSHLLKKSLMENFSFCSVPWSINPNLNQFYIFYKRIHFVTITKRPSMKYVFCKPN